jgi:hypothetical protein
VASTSVAPMEAPTPDPGKLLQSWMEWERGEVTPGRVMANMKTGGMRVLLEELAEGLVARRPGPSASEPSASEPSPPEPSPPEPSPSKPSPSKPDGTPV